MRKTTEAMHRGLADAVVELRRRQEWSQTELADEINKTAREPGAYGPTVARWESGTQSPGPRQRAVLANIAEKHRHEDLAEVFRAPVAAWRFMIAVQKVKGEKQ
jgi:ribosome-binding protein aMBF1 (putative translation factor)